MSFQPAVLCPQPDPFFVEEVKKVDPSLRVVFGYTRYFVKKWVIERRLSPERYASIYAAAIKEDWPRFATQPIYDTGQPIYSDVLDVDGQPIQTGYLQVGERLFDVRPEWECLAQFDKCDSRAILELKRAYAWNYNHPLSRSKFEEEQRLEDEQKEAEAKRKRVDLEMESVEEAWSLFGKRRSYVLDATEVST